MSSISLSTDGCAVVAIDLQPSFLKGIEEAGRVVRRSRFVLQAATLLGVPIIGTVQNVERMGPTDPLVTDLLPNPIAKMSFSCWGAAKFREEAASIGARQFVLVGIETHICVGLTAMDLLREGYEVAVCPDAVSAGSIDRHKLGMERLRDAGAVPIHSETVAYEWMKSAEHTAFRDVLKAVKELR
ncbi:MAG TPA: isochorismatase family protein [Fimbriimonas sp.]|nr:isochorismatase family protein [Fimbriimonas sp.]